MACNFYTSTSPLSKADQVRDYVLSLVDGIASSVQSEPGVTFVSTPLNCDTLIASLCSDFELSDVPYNPGTGNRVQYQWEGVKLIIWYNYERVS